MSRIWNPSGSAYARAFLSQYGLAGDTRAAGRLHRGVELGLVIEVEHEQGLRMGIWCVMTAAAGELEVGAGAGEIKEHSVVTVMVVEATDLGQAYVIAVERDELVELVGVTGDPDLHRLDHGEHARRPAPESMLVGD